MAKKLEEIKAQNTEEANKALGDQLNLVSSLQDKMTDLIKIYREKGTLDKLSLDNIKAVTAATKAYKSEYNSVKEVQKDISRNTQLQNDIAKQTNALTKNFVDGLIVLLNEHYCLLMLFLLLVIVIIVAIIGIVPSVTIIHSPIIPSKAVVAPVVPS